MSTVITIIIVLVVIGFILYLINNYIPMPAIFKTVINVIAVIAVILWLLKVSGIWSGNLGV